MNNSDLAKEVVKLVGGKENILSVIHCVTRLRFKLRDENLAETEKNQSLKRCYDGCEKWRTIPSGYR